MPDGGKADTSLHTFRIHTDAVSALHLVGDTLYSGSYDCSVAAINLVQGAAAHTFHGSQSMVHCVHEREGTVYIGNDGGDILLLDSKSGQMSGALRGHKRAVTCFCSEENILYSGSQDGIIRQWDTRTQKCLRKIKVHSGPVTCVQVVDGTMHSGSWDGSLYTFADGEGRRHWGADRNSPLQSLIPAAGLVYAAYRDGRARVWAPMTTDKVVTTFVGHDAGIPAILVDEQARMYLGSEDRTISVWDLKMQASFVDTEKRSCVYTGHTDGILSLAKGENLLYSGSFDHTIKIWDLKAVDRALFPEIEERSLPLHKLAQGGDQLTKLNDFEVPTVAVLQECLMYLRPQEAVELAYEKLLPNDIGFESKVAKFEVQDPSCVADEPMESIVNAKQLVAGIYDVFDPGAPAMQQAPAFADLIATHSDLFRKMMLKYGDVTDSSIISTRSFWLLAHQCKLVTAKCSLAELDRLFILNRIRQLYPHPRVDEIMNPHAHTGSVRIEDLIFGFVRLAARKYQKQADNAQRFDRLVQKHLLPLALLETPDVLTQVGLGPMKEVLSLQQERAVLKLFVKFSGMDAPEEAMRGDGFLRAVASLNLPSGASDEDLLPVLESCCSLYARTKEGDAVGASDALVSRELVPDELIYGLAVLGKRVQGIPEAMPLSQGLGEFIDKFVVTAFR